MINKQQTGVILNHTAAADIASGAVVVLTNRIGVAVTAIATGETGAVLTEGVVTLPKATGALTQGQDVYWDPVAGNITATATANIKAGFAAEPALEAATSVAVKLNA